MASIRAATATFNLPDIMPEFRTYCIIGQGRGGTTMTGVIVDMLGVPVTKRIVGNNPVEDKEFMSAVQAPILDMQNITEQINKRNVDPVWAWKIPQCGPNLPHWYKLMRNPFWIYVIRDHLASALTEVRVNVVKDALEGLKVKRYHEDFLYNFITKANQEKMPILLLSYERIRLHKGKFLLELTKFLGVNPTIEMIANATDFIEDEGPLQKPKP